MRYLGIDFGLKRIGLAISEGDLASPWKIIEGKNFTDLLKKIEKEAQGFDKVIVGMPEGKIGQTALGFVKALRKRGLDVETADETLSSRRAAAQRLLANIPKQKRGVNDDIAAAIILQDYLDQT